MDNLRLFSTETEYNTSKSGFEYPTVSYVESNDTVYFMTLREKYTNEYLTFEALEDGTFTLNIPANVNSTYMTSVSYSTDDGETWTKTNINSTNQTITTPTINAGSKVLWKGVGKQMAKTGSTSNYSYFSSTNNTKVSGNIMSLLYGDNFISQDSFITNSNNNLCYLFQNWSKLIDCKNLILPVATLTQSCYFSMFNGCTSLVSAPELLATALAQDCCNSMFYNCTSLVNAPELPVITLKRNCYGSMFYNCTSLVNAPELPATTLATSCYASMFQNCTSLVTAPELPATTLTQSCYSSMFYGCTSLVNAPELSATTLASNCYNAMFRNCTSLTTAPELPATTSVGGCYSNMFRGCSNLNYIKAMLSGTGGTVGSMQNWVNGVSATGTFIKNSNSTWLTGVDGIPSGWTVQTASA